MGDASLDKFAPHRFGDFGRQPFPFRSGGDFGENVLDPPFDADIAFAVLNPGGGLYVGLALGKKRNQHPIDPVDFGADLVHQDAVGRPRSGVFY